MNKLTRTLLGLAAFCMSASVFAGIPGEDGAVAVPEPGTLGLLVAGIAVAAAFRLRRKK